MEKTKWSFLLSFSWKSRFQHFLASRCLEQHVNTTQCNINWYKTLHTSLNRDAMQYNKAIQEPAICPPNFKLKAALWCVLGLHIPKISFLLILPCIQTHFSANNSESCIFGHHTGCIMLEMSHAYTLTQYIALKTNVSLGQQVPWLEYSHKILKTYKIEYNHP